MKAYLLMLSAVAVAFIGMGCGNNKGGQPVAPTAEYTLAIELMPIGSGSVDREPNKLTYKAGDSVTVTAKPKDGYAFSHWSGVLNSENDTITLVMNGNLTLTANFVDKPVPPTPKTYTLKITATNGGSVSPAVGTHTYDAETEVAVIATADAGYTFSDWIGASSSTDAAITVKMDGDKVLTANFQEDVTPPPDKFSLTISATVGGSVSPAVGEHFYKADTSVTVTAAADSGYTFNKWSGASSSADAAITVKMDGNKTLTANFLKDVPPPTESTFIDGRDEKTYKKITIGSQTWMAENLNYDVPNNETDVCYQNSEDSCAKYGRLYNWATAMDIDLKYNNTSWGQGSPIHQGACPVGWHLPLREEWDTLARYVGNPVATKLKSTSGWYMYTSVPAGTDEYGFSALPGGLGNNEGGFGNAANDGFWWQRGGYYTEMHSRDEVLRNGSIAGRDTKMSVRCVQDAE